MTEPDRKYRILPPGGGEITVDGDTLMHAVVDAQFRQGATMATVECIPALWTVSWGRTETKLVRCYSKAKADELAAWLRGAGFEVEVSGP